jgi:hypothetical protein
VCVCVCVCVCVRTCGGETLHRGVDGAAGREGGRTICEKRNNHSYLTSI